MSYAGARDGIWKGRGMGLFTEIFAWWTGNTWGTRWTIWRHGRKVGEDALGNRYYEQRRGVGPLGRPRRWVIYRDLSEPTKVPAEWHGWLHYTHDQPPTEVGYVPRSWEKPHLPNQTGTANAYRPPGSILAAGRRPRTGGDYRAWKPE